MSVCTRCGREFTTNSVNSELCPECYAASLHTGIKDSGERTTFSTGAQRDMHGGKGRMDLLPWAAIIEVSKHCEAGALKYGEHNVDKGIPTSSLLDSAMTARGKVSGRSERRGSPAGGGVEPAVGH